MGLGLDSLINENFQKLNNTDLHVLGFVKNNIKLCINLKIAQFAAQCNVSSASILRMTQKLNFSGFSEFKYFLKSEITNKESNHVDTVELLEYDIHQTFSMYSSNPHIIDIYSILDSANHIYIYGTGLGQRLMLEEFSRCMLNVNKHAILVPATGELKIVSKNISKYDLVIIASWSGNIEKYKESLINLSVSGVPILSITNLSNNELSSISTYNLYFQNSFKNKDLNLSRSSYLTLHLVLHLLYDGYENYINEKANKIN